ncbi:MAG: nuclear transport factor 2 family protein [Chitinophagaceae bacterium]
MENTTMTPTMTTQEVAARFNELAQQEKWFEIQEEFFDDNVKSIEPQGSPYMGYAAGKDAVRQKGENFIKTIEAFHGAYTTVPVVGGNYFAVGRGMDLTLQKFGRVKIDQVMMYQVKDGKIISEQFFY